MNTNSTAVMSDLITIAKVVRSLRHHNKHFTTISCYDSVLFYNALKYYII